ncbi:hypothetical protein L202_07666 [Cryptococcus amylolentus CBS 6039]|uniref:Uncharacterized protein n=2 Tax=Cryptococcus amylolentus TaxID=104669 RepID=A0A1E3HD05_9TREE|nr:hypothetical protein L202_07666 [Cryptococcus amylolentus CBS 6039]ODN74220.1 hypothetical protein L202_07666 [Cryptococcus amylolentus CBS 6039]ODO00015.1 hypothetical protein I350_06635 [Cryptococcus amylolentus CBS 6273]
MNHTLMAIFFVLALSTSCQAFKIISPAYEMGWASRGRHLIHWEGYSSSQTIDMSLTYPDSTTQNIFSRVPADQGVAVYTSPNRLPPGNYSIFFSVFSDGEVNMISSEFSVWNDTEPVLDDNVMWIISRVSGKKSGGWHWPWESSAASVSKHMAIPLVVSCAGLALGRLAIL